MIWNIILARDAHTRKDLVPVEGRAVETERPTDSSAVFLVPVKILCFSVF